MENILWKYTLNQQYLIEYKGRNVNVYEIILKDKTNLLFTFKTQAQISSIQFNPLVYNIIMISFNNGTCKIYNILKYSDKEDILFESKKNENITLSLFNIYDPNIIATLTESNDLYIWDIRKLYYLNIIHIKEEMKSLKWSNYDKDYIEIINIKNTVRLISINNNNFESKKKIKEQLIDFLYLKEDILILIKEEKIEKINFTKDLIMKTKNFELIYTSNQNLVKDYNILIIILENNISYFIDIETFSTILEVELFIGYSTYFYYVKGDNEFGLKYINNSKTLSLKERSFEVKDKISKKIQNNNLINISNNFYQKFCPKILKYMCILNFNENIYDKPNYLKQYMYISEINEFFKIIKDVNIFDRKDFVTKLFDCKKGNDQIDKLNDELDIKKFSLIRKFIEIFNIAEPQSRKNKFNMAIKENFDNETIIECYLELIKLLTIDNTNEKLLEIYLLFINIYEKYLVQKFEDNNIEKYENEVKYYSVCFSKENYKELFNLDKKSEKEILFEFLNDINKFDNFNYDNSEFIKFIENFKKKLIKFPDFNQPIEYDCNNNELKWFSIKMHIFATFKGLKVIEKNEYLLGDMKKGLKTVLEKSLLENEDIFRNKNMLQSVVYLITNPCSADNDDLDFFCNSLFSKRNSIEKLKKNYTINNENQLEYENETYDNIEDICLDNLSFKNYIPKEKYNFNYVTKNYVKNKDKLKNFLNNILQKKVFIEAYEVLFGNDYYKTKYKRYLEEFVNNRLEFVPIRPRRASAISDKISLNTFISTQKSKIKIKFSPKINKLNIRKILITAKYVLNEEHEIFHLLNCIPYYENNFSISINTPRKGKYEGENNGEDEDEREGGIYLELLLFNKVIKLISLADALFLLNEKNYDKSLCDFVYSFENKNKEDLIIEGVFNEFNDYLDVNKMTVEELNNSFIEQKSNYWLNSILDSYIVNDLKNDIAGKIYYEEI